MKKLNGVVALLFLVTVVLEIANIFLANSVTTDSIMATQLQEKISAVQEKNQNLRSEILQYTSFDNIASRAASLGFVESTDNISLDSPVEVASSQ